MDYKAELLVKDVVSVAPGETIFNAVNLMKEKHIGCVVVSEGEKVVGIFTERDLVNRVIPDKINVQKTPVSKIMTKDPVTVGASEPLEKVFALLSRRRFRHVPITKDGRAVGMVSLSDFAGVLREVFDGGRDSFL